MVKSTSNETKRTKNKNVAPHFFPISKHYLEVFYVVHFFAAMLPNNEWNLFFLYGNTEKNYYTKTKLHGKRKESSRTFSAGRRCAALIQKKSLSQAAWSVRLEARKTDNLCVCHAHLAVVGQTTSRTRVQVEWDASIVMLSEDHPPTALSSTRAQSHKSVHDFTIASRMRRRKLLEKTHKMTAIKAFSEKGWVAGRSMENQR